MPIVRNRIEEARTPAHRGELGVTAVEHELARLTVEVVVDDVRVVVDDGLGVGEDAVRHGVSAVLRAGTAVRRGHHRVGKPSRLSTPVSSTADSHRTPSRYSRRLSPT